MVLWRLTLKMMLPPGSNFKNDVTTGSNFILDITAAI
jgi:hypothetical protein